MKNGEFVDIQCPKTTPPCRWVGRNGMGTTHGLALTKTHANSVMFEPIGKRGRGNCSIEVPLASIPEMIAFLQAALVGDGQ